MTMREAPAPERSGRLDFVEVGRGLAALAVVIFHANASARFFGGPTWHWPGMLVHGVDFFFVLSGFVILHAHDRDIGRPGRLSRYALKRAVRLLPTLWLVVLGWALVRWLGGVGPRAAVFLGSMLPYPSLGPTIPTVVWTLRHELVFYVLFAVLIASRRGGLALFAAWFCLIVAQLAASLAGRQIGGLPAFFVSGYSADFMLGMLVYRVNRRWPAKPSVLPLLVAVALLAAIVLLGGVHGFSRVSHADYHSWAATGGAFALGIGFAAVLYGLVRLQGYATPPGALLALGTSSYALYLVHTPVNSVMQRTVVLLPASLKAIGLGHLVLVAAGIAAAWAIYCKWERPLAPWLRRMTGLEEPAISVAHLAPQATVDSQSTPAAPVR